MANKKRPDYTGAHDACNPGKSDRNCANGFWR